jgi:hypothetical protein
MIWHRTDWQFTADVAEGPAASKCCRVHEVLFSYGNLCFLNCSEIGGSKIHQDAGMKLQIITASHPVNFNPDHVRTVSKNEFWKNGCYVAKRQVLGS